MELAAQVPDAAFDTIDVVPLLRPLPALVLANLEQLAAVVEGELVVIFTGTVDDDPVHLRVAIDEALHVCRGAGVEHHDVPFALLGVIEHLAQGFLLLLVARLRLGCVQAEFPVYRRVLWEGGHRAVVVLHEEHAPHDDAAYASLFPGVEDLFVVRHVALEWIEGENPAFHIRITRLSSAPCGS